MKKVSLIFFDLDGTLIDSKKDITHSVHHTLNALNLPPLSDELIYSFVGNGVTPLIQQAIESSGTASFEQALEIFKTHYDAHCLDHTKLFPGVQHVLDAFAHKKMVIVTNKSQGFSEKIVKGLGLDRQTHGLHGGDTALPKKPSPDIIFHNLEKFGVSASDAVIVGDSHVDIETGKNAGILTCGVTYGFRPKEELVKSGADFIIDRPEELLRIFS